MFIELERDLFLAEVLNGIENANITLEENR